MCVTVLDLTRLNQESGVRSFPITHSGPINSALLPMTIGNGDADEFQLVFFRDGVIGGTF